MMSAIFSIGCHMKIIPKSIALLAALTASQILLADTFTYEALIDFTDIEAGEVPYIPHTQVNALQINAAKEEYRDKFARATLEFTEQAGLYDVTITTLGETDGEGEYRLLINGLMVGSVINEPTTVDFSPQLHTFNDIQIPANAVIGVESIAVSNGLIPEGGAYAFARGRWTTLALTSDDASSTPDPIQLTDLAIDVTVDQTTATVGDTLSYDIVVSNQSSDITATNPIITIAVPGGSTNLVHENCNEAEPLLLTCSLAELGPAAQFTTSVTATINDEGTNELQAGISADQPDPNVTNNTSSTATEVVPAVTTTSSTVDLSIDISADKSTVEIGDTITYTVTLENVHANNTATQPVAGILLPASLQYQVSDRCTANGQSVICNVEELAPGISTEVNIIALTVVSDSAAQVIASASSAHSEDIVSNNEAQIVSVINRTSAAVTSQPPATPNSADTQSGLTTNTNTGNVSGGSSGGGGVVPVWLLLWLVACQLISRRRAITQPNRHN